jgi:hypothetical protein
MSDNWRRMMTQIETWQDTAHRRLNWLYLSLVTNAVLVLLLAARGCI